MALLPRAPACIAEISSTNRNSNDMPMVPGPAESAAQVAAAVLAALLAAAAATDAAAPAGGPDAADMPAALAGVQREALLAAVQALPAYQPDKLQVPLQNPVMCFKPLAAMQRPLDVPPDIPTFCIMCEPARCLLVLHRECCIATTHHHHSSTVHR